MKRVSVHIAAALLLCFVSVASVSAKVKSRALTVGQDFSIAGKTLKAGTYDFRFDDEKNELTVVDRKTRETVARVEARAETWAKGSLGLQLAGDNAPLAFEGIAFDNKQIIRVSVSAAQGK